MALLLEPVTKPVIGLALEKSVEPETESVLHITDAILITVPEKVLEPVTLA